MYGRNPQIIKTPMNHFYSNPTFYTHEKTKKKKIIITFSKKKKTLCQVLTYSHLQTKKMNFYTETTAPLPFILTQLRLEKINVKEEKKNPQKILSFFQCNFFYFFS